MNRLMIALLAYYLFDSISPRLADAGLHHGVSANGNGVRVPPPPFGPSNAAAHAPGSL